MNNDLTKRVENAAKGITFQTKPDERRHYLGSLRERVFVKLTNAQSEDSKLTALFLAHMEDFLGYQILINDKIPNSRFLAQLEAKSAKVGVPFTLVNNETAQIGKDEMAVLVVAKDAINHPQIELTQVFAPEMPKESLPKPQTKPSFWQRLFGGKNK